MRGSSGLGNLHTRIEKAMIELMHHPYPWERSTRSGELVLIVIVIVIAAVAAAGLILCGIEPGAVVDLIAAALVTAEITQWWTRRGREVAA